MSRTRCMFFPHLGWARDNELCVIFWVMQIWCGQYARGELAGLSIIGKPASASTSHSNHPLPGYAVDGNIDSISHTGFSDPHPWWRVDLETEHCLGRITVILRQDCCGRYRFAAAVARAGLSSNYADNQPCGLPATRAQSLTGATVVFLCDTPRMARYVTLDINITSPDVTDPVLQLAEVRVDVYTTKRCGFAAKIKTADFKLLYMRGLIGNSDPLSTKMAKSLSRCAVFCIRHVGCFSFDFAQESRECHLHNLNSTDIEMTPNDDFSVYVMILE